MQPSDLRGYFAASVTSAEPKSVGGILDSLWAAVAKLGREMLVENRDTVILAVLDAYDLACGAIDIPRIPDFLEVRIEAAGRSALEKALQMLPTE